MKQFYTKVDLRSRRAMVDFLTDHFRYNTMNSWNRSTSYANNIKIYNLGLDREISDKLYDLIAVDGFWSEADFLFEDFAVEHDYLWQVGINGRSDGYVVLYQGYIEPSGYKSYCTACGQRNYTSVKEKGNVCGKCGEAARVDYTTTHNRVGKYHRSVDMDENFEEFSISDLRERVKLVQDFDTLTDNLIALAVNACRVFDIKEEIHYVPQTRKVLVEKATA